MAKVTLILGLHFLNMRTVRVMWEPGGSYVDIEFSGDKYPMRAINLVISPN